MTIYAFRVTDSEDNREEFSCTNEDETVELELKGRSCEWIRFDGKAGQLIYFAEGAGWRIEQWRVDLNLDAGLAWLTKRARP